MSSGKPAAPKQKSGVATPSATAKRGFSVDDTDIMALDTLNSIGREAYLAGVSWHQLQCHTAIAERAQIFANRLIAARGMLFDGSMARDRYREEQATARRTFDSERIRFQAQYSAAVAQMFTRLSQDPRYMKKRRHES